MQINKLSFDLETAVYCPFCGKRAMHACQKEPLSQTCPHLLFIGSTFAEGGFDTLRSDIADKKGEHIHPAFLTAPKGKEADGTIADEIERARIPGALCLELEEPFCPPMGANGDSVYIGFCEVEEFERPEDEQTQAPCSKD